MPAPSRRPVGGVPPLAVATVTALAALVCAGAWITRVVDDPGPLDWVLAALGCVLVVVTGLTLTTLRNASVSQALLWTGIAANALGSRFDQDTVAVATLAVSVTALVGAFLAYRAEQRQPRR